MSELGQLLKNTRLEQGISLDELQEVTKIRKRYLECIEEGDYNALPGNFYVRAFIKSYAEAVGLDPGEVLSLYQNVIPKTSSTIVTENIAPKRSVTKRSDKLSRFVTAVMLVAFFLLIIGLIYYFYYRNYEGGDRYQNNNLPITQQSASPPVESSPSVTIQPTPDTTPLPLTPELNYVATDRGVDYYEVVNASILEIEMTLTGEDCWFRIDKLTANGQLEEILEQGNLARLGSPRTWESDSPVYLNIGRPWDIELTVNGAVLQFGDLYTTRRIQISIAE